MAREGGGVLAEFAVTAGRLLVAMPPEVLAGVATTVAGVVVAMKAYAACSRISGAPSAFLETRLGRQIAQWVRLRIQATGAMLRTAGTATATALRTGAAWAAGPGCG